jgi:hypothetical protein
MTNLIPLYGGYDGYFSCLISSNYGSSFTNGVKAKINKKRRFELNALSAQRRLKARALAPVSTGRMNYPPDYEYPSFERRELS